nr:methyltransferase domain-containing protein [Elioraea thermophila]
MSRVLSEDRLVGGRVRLRQPLYGFRTAIDPVLLAAAVPVEAGEAVLEAGLGTGAAALALLARVPEARVVGIERDAELAEIARANAGLNAAEDRLAVLCGDLADRTTQRAAASLGPFRHAMANPPFFRGGTAPPDPLRRAAAHEEAEAPLSLWVSVLARRLLPRGTLTLILPPERLAEALAACAATGVGSVVLFPLWPRAGQPARRLIMQGVKGGRAPLRLSAGLVLHEGDGFTDEAQAVLRDGDALRLG